MKFWIVCKFLLIQKLQDPPAFIFTFHSEQNIITNNPSNLLNSLPTWCMKNCPTSRALYVVLKKERTKFISTICRTVPFKPYAHLIQFVLVLVQRYLLHFDGKK